MTRTTAHSASQLQAALGFTPDQWGRARAAGVVPEPDLKTPRWSGGVVDDLVARREQLLAALPDDAGSGELMAALGVDYGDWRRAREAGLIPPADRGEYWTRPVADALIARAQEIRAAIPPQPLGGRRCAELLAELTGLQVDQVDVEDLEQQGLTRVVDWYKQWPLYDVAALRALVEDPGRRRVLVDLVAARRAWLAASLAPAEAAQLLGWSVPEFQRTAVRRGVAAGRFDRYDRAHVEAMAADEDLDEQVRADRLLGPDQAAAHLEIRRTDFDYVVAAGWVRRAGWGTCRIGRREVDVPLYRVGDLNAVRDLPGVDWEMVRAVRPGKASPLREYATLPATRAQIIRAFTADLADRHGAGVRAAYDDRRDQWTISWEPGQLDNDTITAAITTDPAVHPYLHLIHLTPPAKNDQQ